MGLKAAEWVIIEEIKTVKNTHTTDFYYAISIKVDYKTNDIFWVNFILWKISQESK